MISSIPVISFVGRKNSGKTTFIVKLISALEGRGVKVACVKQHKHDVPVDIIGKDSWMYAQAGASCSIMSTSRQLSLVYQRKQMAELEELAEMAAVSKCDVLIGESFNAALDSDSGGIADRYVVARQERIEEPRFSPDESAGIITDDSSLADQWNKAGKLIFDLNDAESFADFLCEHYNILNAPCKPCKFSLL